MIERIQHRFTRMIPELKDLSYEERLTRLGLWSLEERRNRADIIEVFRMYKGLSAIRFDTMFELSCDDRTRGNSLKLKKNRCKLDLRKYFFSERVVNRWNSLDPETVSVGSLNAFKSRLSMIRRQRRGFFMDT